MKMKQMPTLFAALVLNLALCGSLRAEPKIHEVVIEHFAFTPGTIDVAVGDTIMFTNRDIAPHTATAADKSWSTGELSRGASAVIIAQTPGPISYFCVFHPTMKGSVTVQASH